MRLKPLFVLSLLLLLFVKAKSQQHDKDSLQMVIEKILKRQPDTLQARQLRELGYEIMESDSGLSKQLLTEALKKSLLLKDPDAITNSYRILGIWHNSFNYKDKALELYRASLASATGNRHLYLVAGAYFNIGNVKYSKGEYDSCIIYYLK